jgi:LuxR family maltose regulon positive regulatory protein
VKVRALGGLSVLLDEKSLAFSGKAQKKPLELLQALIAFGGKEVREDQLAEALWPEAEADMAMNSLIVTQHRLRKLIGDAAIQRQQGRLTLDARCCWVDVWALERQLASLDEACRDRRLDALAGLSERLFAIYRGPFLHNATEQPWLLLAREHWRQKFLRQIEATGNLLSEAERYGLARRCFEKGLEIDPSAEGFYRGLIHIDIRQGRSTEALSTYRRCCQMLVQHFGIGPSRELQALVGQIAGA